MAEAYRVLYIGALIALAILALLALVRAIKGPRIADRIVSINMISTMIISMICILTLMLKEGYLADVAIIYSLIGFLAVVVLCKVYMGVALQARENRQAQEANKND